MAESLPENVALEMTSCYEYKQSTLSFGISFPSPPLKYEQSSQITWSRLCGTHFHVRSGRRPYKESINVMEAKPAVDTYSRDFAYKIDRKVFRKCAETKSPKCILSEKMLAGFNTEWVLGLYPNGVGDSAPGKMALALFCESFSSRVSRVSVALNIGFPQLGLKLERGTDLYQAFDKDHMVILDCGSLELASNFRSFALRGSIAVSKCWDKKGEELTADANNWDTWAHLLLWGRLFSQYNGIRRHLLLRDFEVVACFPWDIKFMKHIDDGFDIMLKPRPPTSVSQICARVQVYDDISKTRQFATLCTFKKDSDWRFRALGFNSLLKTTMADNIKIQIKVRIVECLTADGKVLAPSFYRLTLADTVHWDQEKIPTRCHTKPTLYRC